MPAADGRVAAADNHDVASQRARGIDGRRCPNHGFEPEVPAQTLGRRGQRQDLHVRGRVQQPRRVAPVDDLTAGMAHYDAPGGFLPRGRDDGVELLRK
jgi:hypothetical protein